MVLGGSSLAMGSSPLGGAVVCWTWAGRDSNSCGSGSRDQAVYPSQAAACAALGDLHLASL